MTSIARRAFVAFLASVVIAGCGGGGSGGDKTKLPAPRVSYTYAVPDDIGDGWQVANLSDEGFDAQLVLDMMDQVVNEDFIGIDSVAIVRNNKLVLYWFDSSRRLDQFDDWINNANRERHVLHSTSKSFTSALVGIAVDQGFIPSTATKFYDLFNYSAYANWDPRKAEMTLEDALTMRLGLEWDEWSLPYTNPDNDLVDLNNNNRDWARALLDLPMAHDPGTVFKYNTAATNAIGQAVVNATGVPLADFANANLFFPMQILDAAWDRTPTGLPVGGSGLFLKTRDFAKFGQLYLNNGAWQGQQLISSDWIADSVVRRADVSAIMTFSKAYGFQWWLGDFSYKGQPVETWLTAGYGGQYMFVIPSLDLVVAFTGHNYEPGPGVDNLFSMMRVHILGAID